METSIKWSKKVAYIRQQNCTNYITFNLRQVIFFRPQRKIKSCKCTKVLPAIGLNNNCHDKLIILELKILLKVKIKSTDVMSWYEYLFKLHVMSTNSSQIEWRDLASFTSPHSQKSNTRQTQKILLNFMRQKTYNKRFTEKEWKTLAYDVMSHETFPIHH